MKPEAEYNEIVPTISFDRFHAYSEILTKIAQRPSSSRKSRNTKSERIEQYLEILEISPSYPNKIKKAVTKSVCGFYELHIIL